MNEKCIKILKITAYTGIIAVCTFAIVKSCINKHKQKKHEKMLFIAKQLNTDIKNTDRKTSPRYHDKNQEKYDELWGNESTCN